MQKRLNQSLKIYTDGASRGNPGPASIAFVIVKEDEVIHQKSEFIGKATNNQAEYQAIIKALSEAVKIIKNGNIELFSDSELVIKQLNGEYRVRKPHLLDLFNEIRELIKKFQSIAFIHVERTNEWIKIVDKLCNTTLNKKTGL
jgi:ribonuclease HI